MSQSNFALTSKATKILQELGKLKAPVNIDPVELINANPISLLQACGAILTSTPQLQRWTHGKGYHLRFKSDYEFIRIVFHIMRTEFSYVPILTAEQFLFQPGFVEKKLDIILSLLQLCVQKSIEIEKEELRNAKQKEKRERKVNRNNTSKHVSNSPKKELSSFASSSFHKSQNSSPSKSAESHAFSSPPPSPPHITPYLSRLSPPKPTPPTPIANHNTSKESLQVKDALSPSTPKRTSPRQAIQKRQPNSPLSAKALFKLPPSVTEGEERIMQRRIIANLQDQLARDEQRMDEMLQLLSSLSQQVKSIAETIRPLLQEKQEEKKKNRIHKDNWHLTSQLKEEEEEDYECTSEKEKTTTEEEIEEDDLEDLEDSVEAFDVDDEESTQPVHFQMTRAAQPQKEVTHSFHESETEQLENQDEPEQSNDEDLSEDASDDADTLANELRQDKIEIERVCTDGENKREAFNP
ncbi:putative centrosomal protein CEP44 [Monocercomonoides exilis]|uniref:putative centrosomal protein CEP44 n=1 Tax=Monocercomonoides exilis TaxID=2049356 RepID=UPI00355A8E56|nr:putative centrosomal protein CEP44 [Monocercomonoides exilis]|eukprot:MONOS_233.1-p1 / transcript=MONOS_233.1 / gene=MONOS_233 / organism=Monocercomonoides_exilis_PA203 / gene_product=unspecified product / transcript_product=unspecified product / location=Mono_scaffold00004:49839-51408(+) / protein_length=466 / sequence_SO=supercontig / SO=protein_coding / is_pseudo=false